MQEELLKEALLTILSRRKEAEGGVSPREKAGPRPDATSWAVLALKAAGEPQPTLERASRFLTRFQLADGRVVFSQDAASSFWPTPLAVLAWRAISGFEPEAKRAIGFLLATSGAHFKKKKDSPTGHDTAIHGWSWVEATHSWVEPTALAMLALRAGRHAGHARVAEAARLLLDRQLSSGGWNYGNTTVFGQELLPMPDSTGLSLSALAGMTNEAAVEKSIGYALEQIGKTDTPFSLFWLACGISAWGIEIPDLRERILKCLALQKRRRPYETTLLSMLLLAYCCEGKVLSFLGVG